uniref:long-chain-fatty-acid--CoA ligase n=1 Tax=Parastrongyloides trichosuri TaxID=131310 RepID=A0A0N4ZRR9_PARTI
MNRFLGSLRLNCGNILNISRRQLCVTSYLNTKLSDGHQPTVHEMLTHPHEILNKHEIFAKTKIPKTTRLGLLVVESLFKLTDIITYLPDKISKKSKKRLEEANAVQSLSIIPGDKSGPYRHIDTVYGELTTTPYEGVTTLKDLIEYVHNNFGHQEALGEREILNLYSHIGNDGVETQLVKLGDYKFITYETLIERIEGIKRGLHKLGLKKGDKVCLYAETRQEWLTMALACYSQGYVVVTAYSTLGKEALITVVNETNTKLLIATESYFDTLKDIVKDMPNLEGMIYFRERFRPSQEKKDMPAQAHERVEIPLEITKQLNYVYHYDDLLESFTTNDIDVNNLVYPDDIAMIMYTSGSTGTPKGVPMKNKALIATLSGLVNHISDYDFTTMIGYLPASHITELAAELCNFSMGKRIGFSSPLTLIDTSTKILPGTKGDCSVLKPDFFISVPAILNRIKKAVSEKLRNESVFKRKLFQMCYDRKIQKFKIGRNTPIIDRIIFKKIKNILGGNAKLIFTGGSAVDEDTHKFVSTCLLPNDGIIMQAYGSTEGSISNTMNLSDMEVGTVGYPMTCSEVLLKSWEEGNYSVDDDIPRGEILIAGTPIFDGYFNKSNDDVFYNSHGKKWYCTGDIGEIKPNGALSIIDRKKDLIKLTTAEYIPVGKVETILLSSPYVDQVCVVGRNTMDYLIAIVVANEKNIRELALSAGHDGSFNELCKIKALRTLIIYSWEEKFRDILQKNEIPRKVILETTPWTIESQLLTDSLKIKRKNIEKKYENILDKVYRPFEEKIDDVIKV